MIYQTERNYQMNTQKHMQDLQDAYQAMQENFETIKRLMPIVEAQLTSQMGGVGATLGKNLTKEKVEFRNKVRTQFTKSLKISKS